MVSGIKTTEKVDKLVEFNWDRRRNKLKRLETLQASKEFMEEVDSQYFEDLGDNQMQHSEEHKFSHYIEQKTKLPASNIAIDSIDIASIDKFIAAYTLEVDFDIMLDYFDDSGLNKTEVDRLTAKLDTCDEEISDSVLDGFFKASQLSIPEIYLVLSYLFDKFKSTSKKRLLNLIKDLISSLEQQNSGVLYDFFSLAKHPAVNNNLKLASKIANLSGDSINSANIKQVLAFLKDTFAADFDSIISNCLRYRSQILADIKAGHGNNFEELAELGMYLRLEKNLGVIYSLYLKLRQFSKKLEDNKFLELKLSMDYHKGLNGIVNFTELSFVSEISIKTLLKQLGIGTDIENTPGIINVLLLLISGLPLALFNDVNGQKQKIIDGIRTYFKELTPSNEPRKFDFIKNKKINIEYV